MFGELFDFGYEPNQPCNTRISIYDKNPEMKIREEFGIEFTAQFGIDLYCKMNNTSQEFSHVFTILSNHIDLKGRVSII